MLETKALRVITDIHRGDEVYRIELCYYVRLIGVAFECRSVSKCVMSDLSEGFEKKRASGKHISRLKTYVWLKYRSRYLRKSSCSEL